MLVFIASLTVIDIIYKNIASKYEAMIQALIEQEENRQILEKQTREFREISAIEEKQITPLSEFRSHITQSIEITSQSINKAKLQKRVNKSMPRLESSLEQDQDLLFWLCKVAIIVKPNLDGRYYIDGKKQNDGGNFEIVKYDLYDLLNKIDINFDFETKSANAITSLGWYLQNYQHKFKINHYIDDGKIYANVTVTEFSLESFKRTDDNNREYLKLPIKHLIKIFNNLPDDDNFDDLSSYPTLCSYKWLADNLGINYHVDHDPLWLKLIADPKIARSIYISGSKLPIYSHRSHHNNNQYFTSVSNSLDTVQHRLIDKSDVKYRDRSNSWQHKAQDINQYFTRLNYLALSKQLKHKGNYNECFIAYKPLTLSKDYKGNLVLPEKFKSIRNRLLVTNSNGYSEIKDRVRTKHWYGTINIVYPDTRIDEIGCILSYKNCLYFLAYKVLDTELTNWLSSYGIYPQNIVDRDLPVDGIRSEYQYEIVNPFEKYEIVKKLEILRDKEELSPKQKLRFQQLTARLNEINSAIDGTINKRVSVTHKKQNCYVLKSPILPSDIKVSWQDLLCIPLQFGREDRSCRSPIRIAS